MDDERAVWVQPPPAPVLRVVNPVMRRLLLSPLASRLPAAMAVLEFTGRRYAVPVGVHQVQDGPVVFTEAGWGRNFVGGHQVAVRRGRVRRAGRGVLVEDPVAVAHVLGVVLARVGAAGLAMRTAPDHSVTHDDLVRLGRGMVRLELKD